MMRPEEIYQRIEAKNWRHVWVVGDIHGCFSMLMKRLRECRFDPQQDLLVSVGDLIDRGPDSLGCLALLRESWMTASLMQIIPRQPINGKKRSTYIRFSGAANGS